MTARQAEMLASPQARAAQAPAAADPSPAAGARGAVMEWNGGPDLFGPPPVDVSAIPADVVRKFEVLAFEVADRGYSKYSARTILHRIRWHYAIERGDREFKCNDHWSPPLARWFMQKHPEHTGFFELRASQCEKVGG